MPKSELSIYKENVAKQLARLSPLLQKYAMGDFSKQIPIPKEENEFTELLVGLNLMVDDIKELINEKEETINEINQIKDTLLIEKKFTETVLNAQQDTFFLFEPATGKAIRWNQAFRDITGYTDEEINQLKAPDSYYSPKDLERAFAFIQKVLKKGKGTIELELICKDGKKIPTEYMVSVIKDKKGKPKYFISIGRDISEHKQAEEKLRESMEKYYLLVENTPSVLWKTSTTGRTVFISSNIKDIYGYSPEEIYADGYNSWMGRIHNEDLSEVKKCFQELFIKGKKFDVEYRIKRKDGEWIWLHDVASVVHKEEGDEYAYGVFTDITERKKAEEKLKSLSVIVEQSTEGIALSDLKGNLLFVNKAWCKMHGYKSTKNLLGKNLKIFHNEKQLKNEVIPFNETVRKRGTCSGEVWHITKEGSTFPTLMTSNLLKDDQDNPFAMAGIAKDITERKRVLTELNNSRQFLSDVFNGIQDGISVLDSEFTITQTNKWMEKMYSDKMPLNGKKCYQVYQGRKSLCPWCPSKQTLDDHKHHIEIVPYPNAKNPSGWIELSSYPLTDSTGKLTGVIEHVKDISDRKLAEEEIKNTMTELENSNRELAKALNKVKTLSGLIPICSVCKKIRDDTGYWNLLELYIKERSDAEFTHGLCPECEGEIYPLKK